MLRAFPPQGTRMDTSLILYLLAGVLILAGLAGTILPALPGLPLMFAGMLLAAWTDDFKSVSIWVVVLLAVLTLVSIGVDLLASTLGAKRAGASKKALAGAALGTLAGLFLGIPGLLLGPFVGAVAGELMGGREWRAASKVGFATWLGIALGAALKLALAFAMLGIFVFALLVP
jgi:uncharacterized protein YqgC (DUF456 family)